jgi:SAM-dependent methyltransferase
MSKYTFFSGQDGTTAVGRWIVARQNRFLIGLIEQHHSSAGPVSLLEVGPGHGAFARACTEHGLAYEAVEGNATMAARLKNDGYVVTVSTVPPLPGGEKRNVIVMQHVLEHMRGVDEALALLCQCAERLVPGGLLIVCGPDVTVMKDDFFDCDYTHIFPTSVRRLTQILHDAGLTVVASGLQNALGTCPLLLRTVGACARLAYTSGLFGMLFGDRAYTAKTSLYASCYAVGRLDAANRQ